MKKSIKESRIEVWGTNYINKVEIRERKDKEMDIVQIEATKDTSNFIVEIRERANRYISWIPISVMMPEKTCYDWVLVRIEFEDGNAGIPHIAELVDGVWRSRSEGNLEENLGCTVTHWKPIPDEKVE